MNIKQVTDVKNDTRLGHISPPESMLYKNTAILNMAKTSKHMTKSKPL